VLWLARVSSAIGDVLVPVALAFAVLALRDSALAYGLVLATFTASRVVFSLVGGVIADRFSRRSVLLTCDVVRGGVEIFTAAMLFAHDMTVPLFVLTSAVFGAAGAFFGPASTALLPQTVSARNLQPANALLAMSQNTLNIFGPAVSGAIILATHTTAWVFVLDAATFAASAAFLLQLRVVEPPRSERPSFALELRAGFQEVRQRSWVVCSLVGFSISNACLAAFLVLGPVIVRRHHHGAAHWAVIVACGALGAVMGGYLSGRTRPRRPLVVAFGVSILLALPLAALAKPLDVASIAVAFGLGFGSIAYANVLWETTLQRRIPGSVLGRVRSYDQLVSFVFTPVGFVAFGAIADGVGAEPTLFVAAAAVAAINLSVALSPCLRGMAADEPPAFEPAEVRAA